MRIGPFRSFDFEDVKLIMDKKNIVYDIFIDKELEKTILADFHSRSNSAPREAMGSLDLAIFYFDIDDVDFEKIADDVEKYGIVAPSDGTYELGDD